MVVNPGEQVSFNEVTGPQTKENGYKVATIILNGKFVDGVGGGMWSRINVNPNIFACGESFNINWIFTCVFKF